MTNLKEPVAVKFTLKDDSSQKTVFIGKSLDAVLKGAENNRHFNSRDYQDFQEVSLESLENAEFPNYQSAYNTVTAGRTDCYFLGTYTESEFPTSVTYRAKH